MKKTATEIAEYVLAKLAEDAESETIPPANIAMRGLGIAGGGVIGGLLGGAAGAGLGSSLRSCPGYAPLSRISKALSKTFRNPAVKGVATALPYLGIGSGAIAGARKGHQLLNVGPELGEEDIHRILEEAYGKAL